MSQPVIARLCAALAAAASFLPRAAAGGSGTLTNASAPVAAHAFDPSGFTDQYCADCHDDVDHKGNLDLTSLAFKPEDPANFDRWVKVHDRLLAHEMPPRKADQPASTELQAFLARLTGRLNQADTAAIAREGRATQRRLNGYEYENALRDVLSAPWLELRGGLPEDGELDHYNKLGEALDVSHVQISRYLSAADGALRQVMSTEWQRPAPTLRRYYARDQRTLTSKFTGSVFNSSPDRMTYPVVGVATPQPDVRWRRVPLSDPKTRDIEAVAWVSSNYVTGFTYLWDQFRAPVPGRYRVRFSGYTLWVPPGGIAMAFSGESDHTGRPRPPNPYFGDYDRPEVGRRNEPITVYTRNGILSHRVGSFDLTPQPAVYDLGEVWLQANETLVPDASRFYRSRPPGFRNPLMTKAGAPSVAFRWMEVEGPITDDASSAGYRLLFGDLPMRKTAPGMRGVVIPTLAATHYAERGRKAGARAAPLSSVSVEVVTSNPDRDSETLLRGFLARAYRRPVEERDVQRFLALYHNRRDAGASFTEAMIATYTAVLSSPGFLFLQEPPGRLDDYALATRLSLFLWNSVPDDELRGLAARGELHHADVLLAQTDRMLADSRAKRFVEAFLDYWVDLRKIDDSTPSTSLYNDYYIDDSLEEAALDETRMYFTYLLAENRPVRELVASNYTFLNQRLAEHYGLKGVSGVAMRRVVLPPDCVRGGMMTQASVLKVTANGTNTSPVQRGKWIMERILGQDIPPPPPISQVEPDIRGAVTLRQQLAKHRDNASCATCHSRMDPPGFALESFDVMGGWRDRYRALDDTKQAVLGRGKNGQLYEFCYALPVDASGELPDGRKFAGIRDFKQLLLTDETALARNLAKQLLVYGTGAPMHFTDRTAVDRIVAQTKPSGYGVKAMVEAVVQSDPFRTK